MSRIAALFFEFFSVNVQFFIIPHFSTKLLIIRTKSHAEFDRVFFLFVVILAYSIDCLIKFRGGVYGKFTKSK